jgi:DNA modification methylase
LDRDGLKPLEIAEIISKEYGTISESGVRKILGLNKISQKRLPQGNFIKTNLWFMRDDKNKPNQNFIGNTPQHFLEHLLYYHTNKGDMVVDLFAGTGTMIDACEVMGNDFLAYDMGRHYKKHLVTKHKIQDGLPQEVIAHEVIKLVFLDPPYWKQAEGIYSDDPDDLGNMPLDKYNAIMGNLFLEICKAKNIELVAFMINPTIYVDGNFTYVDHSLTFHQFLAGNFDIIRRYHLQVISRQQAYLAEQIERAKLPMEVVRDIWVYKRNS